MRYTIQRCKNVYLLFCIFTFTLLSSNLTVADTVKINFTADDTYSIAAPNMKSLPEESDLDVIHRITFDVPGVYLYQCTPHGNMGMLGLIVVGNNYDNIGSVGDIELSHVAKSVLQRLIRVAKSTE